jgi:hypothetical protein
LKNICWQFRIKKEQCLGILAANLLKRVKSKVYSSAKDAVNTKIKEETG